MSHLSSGKVNIVLVQEAAKKELLRLLGKCDGTKAIVWDRSLAGPVGLIAKYDLLRENDVVKMFPLENRSLPKSNVKNLIFVTRPELKLMQLVANIIHAEEQAAVKNPAFKKEYHLFFVPRRSLVCEKWLMSCGVFGTLTFIEEFVCDLFPFDSDLMSMELDSAFKEFHLENDPKCLYYVAHAIMTLQSIFGTIPQVYGKGVAAKQVWDLVCRITRERTGTEKRPSASRPRIDRLLLIDRAIDLMTPLATQLTYEGLIDEIFGINNTTAQFPTEKFAKSDEGPIEMSSDKKQIILNSGEELFAEIRDKNFNAVGPALSRKARHISSQLEEKKYLDKSMQEIKQFVARLPHMMAAKASLATHTTIAELIKGVTDSETFLEALQTEQEFMNGIETDKVHAYIEDCIAKKEPLVRVLRLICIQSVANSGLKPKVLEYYKREIIHSYGFEHILSLSNLETAGLLKPQHGSRQYTILRKTLHLTVEDNNEVTPTDISYVHSIYAPLSVRIAQHAMRTNGWRGLQDVLGILPGPSFEETQTHAGAWGYRRDSIGSQSSQSDTQKIVLVFFIGGCTFSEISALRFLSQQEDSNVEYIVATTKLINGNTFIQSLMENANPDDEK